MAPTLQNTRNAALTMIVILCLLLTRYGVFAESSVLQGDVDGDGYIGLSDVILSVQISAGFTNQTSLIFIDADVDGNREIGIAEGLFALQALAEPEKPTDTYTNSLGMTFKLIPAGTFMMGSAADDTSRDADETQHQVTLTESFYMQATEVTQGEWQAVMSSNPSSNSDCGDECPVEKVSWNNIQDFLTELNNRDEGTYRLPTEAEWEYAARAGSTTEYAFDLDRIDEYVWYYANSDSKTHPVGQKLPNAWGLYDMQGNVWEWCQDWYESSFPAGSVTDPAGPDIGSDRVIRGGCWINGTSYFRSADRNYIPPSSIDACVGFRLVRTH